MSRRQLQVRSIRHGTRQEVLPTAGAPQGAVVVKFPPAGDRVRGPRTGRADATPFAVLGSGCGHGGVGGGCLFVVACCRGCLCGWFVVLWHAPLPHVDAGGLVGVVITETARKIGREERERERMKLVLLLFVCVCVCARAFL